MVGAGVVGIDMKSDYAETVGLRALAWIVQNDALRDIFLGASGASTDDLRTGATDPAFLGSILEFICMDDAWVVEFCDANELDYTTPMMARQMLPGGEQVHWT